MPKSSTSAKKKAKSASPTQRTLSYLRDMGYEATVVEQTIRIPARGGKPPSQFKRDAFGFGDVLAYRPNEGIILVQATSTDNIASRRTKIQGSEHRQGWIDAGRCECGAQKGRILLIGWEKRGSRWVANYEEIE